MIRYLIHYNSSQITIDIKYIRRYFISMNILVLTTSFPTMKEKISLGASFILTECLAYEKAGANVTVIAPSNVFSPNEEIFGNRIHLKRFTYFFSKKLQVIKKSGDAIYRNMNFLFYIQAPFFLFFFMLKILKHAKKSDIIHCNWTLTALLAIPAKYIFKKPLTLTIRGGGIRMLPKFINRFILKNVDAVIDCLGPFPERALILKPFSEKIKTLPALVMEPPKNVYIKSSKKDSEFKIMYVGRFDEYKHEYGFGFFYLIDAIQLIKNKKGLKFVFVGDGPLYDSMVSKCTELGVNAFVEFTGYQPDIYQYIREADLVVGGIGLNAISQEASIIGKPQLILNIKGRNQGIWNDKENCLLYEPKNSESIRKAIEYILKNRNMINIIKKNVSRVVEKFIRYGKDGGEIYLDLFNKIINKTKHTT